MSRWWKRTAMLVAGASLLVVLAVGSANARPFESTSVQKAQSHSLNIYGLGGRDDIAQGRLDVANAVIRNLGHSVNNPVGSFNNQAFLARLAARDIPDLVHMGRGEIGTYAARGALIPLANCIASEKIDRTAYHKA